MKKNILIIIGSIMLGTTLVGCGNTEELSDGDIVREYVVREHGIVNPEIEIIGYCEEDDMLTYICYENGRPMYAGQIDMGWAEHRYAENN